ncbi:MAG: S-layer homology domain-containing protein [Oscillospiraceae bacterium]|nr:S-layer homology domain-containing protein [Oscillospiraceae bacterium]
MNRLRQRCVGLLVLSTLLMSLVLPAAAGTERIGQAVQTSADYMLTAVPAPAVGSVGGEWAVIGLARSGCNVPQDYWDGYYQRVEQTVKNSGGVLHQRKYTEYSRLVLALTAVGADPTDVAGYDLLAPLGDFDKVVWQGVNGPIYALLALDCGDYEMGQVRQRYVDYILARQFPDGGWSLTDTSDPDLTGMALQALASYQSQPKAAAAIQKALDYLSGEQNRNGSFDTLESTAQVLVALCELGLGPNYAPLTGSGNTLLDGLLSFRRSDGSFIHAYGQSGNDQMASEQGLYALAAAVRATEGRASLYHMDDVTICVSGESVSGLPGKHPDVLAPKRTDPGRTFSDIAGHPSRTAIEALAQRGITAGKGNGRFDPDTALTRGEFTTLIVRTLGLTPISGNAFRDVARTAWYAGFVGTAHRYGIVSGVGAGKFDPEGTITRQQAAVMVTKAAALCGMETGLTQAKISDTLSLFGDYPAVSSWARASVAFCCRSGIWDNSAWGIQPNKYVSRAEMAQMLYNLLSVCHMLGG